MVAKSYQGLPILGEKFQESSKWYIYVQLKNGNRKKVRFYDEKEYKKLYPEEQQLTADKYFRTQKYTLGFEKGFIYIFKGVTTENEDWFKYSPCRFARYWGWDLPSTEEVPADLPSGVEVVKLNWDIVGGADEKVIAESAAIKAVQTLLKSTKVEEIDIEDYPHSVRDRINLEVEVLDKTTTETRYGKSHYYKMKGDDECIYFWNTAARDWPVGAIRQIRGTIKEIDNGITLTHCTEV